MDEYDQLIKVKKMLKLNNNELGALIDKTGDTFRKGLNRRSLSDYEIKALAKSLASMNLHKNEEEREEVEFLLNMIRKKIRKNKSNILDKILSEEEEGRLKDKIKDDPAYSDLTHRKPINTGTPSLGSELSDKGVPYYDIDFTLSLVGVENNQQVQPDSYVTHPFFNGCDYIVRASGQSMAKIIKHGDAIGLIKIQNWQDFIPLGEVYAIVTKNGFRMVKVITKGKDDNHFKLVSKPSDSKKDEFPDQEIKKSNIVQIYKVQASSHLF